MSEPAGTPQGLPKTGQTGSGISPIPVHLTPELVEKVTEKVYALFLREMEIERVRHRLLAGSNRFKW
jgi:hypothetical protein